MFIRNNALKLATILLASVSLSGCWAHNAPNHDRVTFGAGNAVHANLEMQTVNPSSASRYDVTGLGQDGVQTSAQD